MRYLSLVALILMLIQPCLTANEIKAGEKTFISLNYVAKRMGMQFEWIVPGKKARLKSQWTDLSFEVHKNYTFLNDNKVFLGTGILERNKHLYVAKDDFLNTLSPLLTPQVFKSPPKLKHIVLDPGHGGSDKGTKSKALGLREKDLVLDIAFRLEKILKKEGYQVTLTRRSDKFIPLLERSANANKINADLFVSIHLNAVANNADTVKGAETYILPQINQPSTGRSEISSHDKQEYPGNKNAPWSTLLAYCVQTSLVKNIGRTDRGLKRARFAVLKELKCPGILVEGGFLTHNQESRQLASAAHREQIADAMAQGIFRYGKALDKIKAKQ